MRSTCMRRWGGAGFSYLATDGLGSANAVLNTSGGTTASTRYAPYGGSRYSSGTMPTDYGFTGQHADSATGLDYYNARYYDPLAGQFVSADSILPGAGYDVLGLSRYAYVEGNPVVRTDPTGHCFPICAIIAGFVVGAAIVYGAQVIGNLQKGRRWHSFTTNINLGNVMLGGVPAPQSLERWWRLQR